MQNVIHNRVRQKRNDKSGFYGNCFNININLCLHFNTIYGALVLFRKDFNNFHQHNFHMKLIRFEANVFCEKVILFHRLTFDIHEVIELLTSITSTIFP